MTCLNKDKMIFISGPCVIENRRLVLDTALYLKELLADYPFDFIFKASFDKANRTSLKSFRGPGLKKGLKILEAVKKKTGVAILSDIHLPEQADYAKDFLDVIQIPAFLSRQTDLLVAAGKTKKTVNIKKAQFMSPYDIKYAVEKVESTGNKSIFLTERGTVFGYNNLVVDFRSFGIMKGFNHPVIFDVTHSLQFPSGKAGISGGDRSFVRPLALAAVAAGVNGFFMEVHPRPQKSLSDKHTSYPLDKLKKLLTDIERVYKAVR
ncbi:MAG: 3-deoxy-8-phosphooctulonate synthase [Candidatus Omnitrophica bacterium]|nr:3-deoxy-8-phosphooctulonate synthase [Candidatus Omnitrophota bacterium]MBD3269566.1 3-deoxy-8-phosphooctulonate synthase [Candidatus Omnitrophota bacterium]